MTADGDWNHCASSGRMVLATPRGHLDPGISVLVPVRNGMPHLLAQLDALARQTYQGRWEIIFSDNGSTDDSIRAIRAAGAHVPLRIVDSREAVGRAGALAVAAGVARGQLLLFCDADDIVADDWVERMKAALDHWPAGRRVPRRGITQPAGGARLAPAGHSWRVALPVRAAARAHRGELRGLAGCLRDGRWLRSLLPGCRG